MQLPFLNLYRLKNYRKVLRIVSCALIFYALPYTALADDEAEIRATFQSLQQSFTARDGTQALTLLSADTKDYYRMLSKIASGKKNDKLDKTNLTPLNLMMIKYVKNDLPKDFWKDTDKSNPDKLLKFAVHRGLGSMDLTEGVSLGEIKVEGLKAAASLIKNAKTLPMQLGFQKEAGKWKVNLLLMFEQANHMAEAFLKKTGLTIEEMEKLSLKN